jgi:hypothetical protein
MYLSGLPDQRIAFIERSIGTCTDAGSNFDHPVVPVNDRRTQNLLKGDPAALAADGAGFRQ